MSNLLLLILIGIAAWLGWRTYKRERARIEAKMREGRTKRNGVTTLERDPKTGVYRPSEDRD